MSFEKEISTKTNLKYNRGYYVSILSDINLFLKRAEEQSIHDFFNILCDINHITETERKDIIHLFSTLTQALYYLKKENEVILSINLYKEHLTSDNLIKIYKTRRDFPNEIKNNLRLYLIGIPDFKFDTIKHPDSVENYIKGNGFRILSLIEQLPVNLLLNDTRIINLIDNLHYEQLDIFEENSKKAVEITHTLNKIKYNNSLNAIDEKEVFNTLCSFDLDMEVLKYQDKKSIILENILNHLYSKNSTELFLAIDDYIKYYLKNEKSDLRNIDNLLLDDKLNLFYSNYFSQHYHYTDGSFIKLLLLNYDKTIFFAFMEKYQLDFNIPLIASAPQKINSTEENEEPIYIVNCISLHEYAASLQLDLVKHLKDENISIWQPFKYEQVIQDKIVHYNLFPLSYTKDTKFSTEQNVCFMIDSGTIDENLCFDGENKGDYNIFEILLRNKYYIAFKKLYHTCKSKDDKFKLKNVDKQDGFCLIKSYFQFNHLHFIHPEIYNIFINENIPLIKDINQHDFESQLNFLGQVSDEAFTTKIFMLEPLIPSQLKERICIFEKEIEDHSSINNIQNETLIPWFDSGKLSRHLSISTGAKTNLMNTLLNSHSDKKPLLTIKDESFFIELENKLPNFKEVIDYYKGQFRQNHYGNKKRINPILLLGEPGIGKTYFSKQLATYLKTGYHFIDMASISAGWVLSGMNGTWQDAKQGKILDIMIKSSTFNPIVLLDELDKAGSGHTYDSTNCLYQLLEEINAQEFIDEFIDFPFDTSGIIYIACANSIQTLSEPLLSRFKVFTIPSPNYDQLDSIINNIYYEAIKDNPLLNPTLHPELLHYLKNNSLREVKVLLEEGITNALLCYSREQLDQIIVNKEKIVLQEKHFRDKKLKSKIGF